MKNRDRTTRISYIVEAAFEYFISLFVTGTMLGYLLDTLGFSDAVQGVICTVATFTCGAQLFALVVNNQRRKRFVVIGHLINQLCFVSLYLLPVFKLSPNAKSTILVVLLVSGHLINNAINPSKITWLMSAVPNESRGSFTAIKEMISLSGGIAVSLIFGRIADTYRDPMGMPTGSYYVICSVALLLMTLIHTIMLLVSNEKRSSVPIQKISIGKTARKLSQNQTLIKVIGVGMMWNFASALSVSFFTSYQRDELAFSFTVIALITTIGSVCRIVVSPILGRIADKYSFATSMTISFFCASIAFLSIVFTTPQTRWIFLVYTCLYAFSMAGINSGIINLIYDYVSDGERAAAMGIKNALGGILAFFTSLLSGFILSVVQKNGGIHLFGFTLYAQQLLAFLSFTTTALLIIYMRKVIVPLRKVQEKTNVNQDESLNIH